MPAGFLVGLFRIGPRTRDEDESAIVTEFLVRLFGVRLRPRDQDEAAFWVLIQHGGLIFVDGNQDGLLVDVAAILGLSFG